MRSSLILFLSLAHLHGGDLLSSDWDNLFLISPTTSAPEDVRWEEGEVRYLEGGRRDRRGATGEEKRIIELDSASLKNSLEIELERVSLPPFTFALTDEDSRVEITSQDSPISCHWKGKVQGGGSAALSTCLHPHGFSGVVITAEGIWYIHPSPKGRIPRSTRKRIPHLMLPPESTANQLKHASHLSDVARVPLAKLEEAARLAAADALERERSREGLPLSYSRGGSNEYNNFDGGGPSTHEYYYNNYYNNNPYSGAFSNYFESSNGGRYWGGGNNLLARRSRTPEKNKKWVEMALFTDQSLYKRMETKFPNDTLNKLKEYAATMINTMDLLYGQKSLGVEIGFRLVHLEVMKKVPKELDSNGGKAKAYLSSFCEYSGNQNKNGGLWDHALLLTGMDLHEEGLKSTAGLAWAGTMCYRYYSCSVAEGFTFGSAFIITHEMGHSLGMEHDGVGISEQCNRDKFIMSPTTGPGKITWSNCSGKNLEDFIEYGTSELRAKQKGTILSQPTCLSEIVSTLSSSKSKEKLPGETYDAYFQCALGLGNAFKPYFQRNKPPFNNICWILYCGNGTHAVSTHPALEGTKCDKDKHCRGGECIPRA